jgi:VanZ family protein
MPYQTTTRPETKAQHLEHLDPQRDIRAADDRPRHAFVVLAIIAIGIVLGSLYPFAFRVPPRGDGAFTTLIETWAIIPSRGDILANILLYIPLGLFAVLAQRPPVSVFRSLFFVIAMGGVLSVLIELSQYFDEGRVTNAFDVYTNSFGTAIGAITGRTLRGNVPTVSLSPLISKPIPTLLIMSWVAYRLYPYVPAINLHKYWNALKPVVVSPSLNAFDLYRYTVIWLTLFVLIAALVGERRAKLLAPLFSACMLLAKVLIISATLSVAEIAGAVLATCLGPILALNRRWRGCILAVLLSGYVIAERLEPFDFLSVGRAFGWVPFASFLGSGSLVVNTLSFFEKAFLYGGLLFLWTEAGLHLGLSAVLVASVLFTTSWLEIYLPGRSAEITDGVMALLIALIFGLLRPAGGAIAKNCSGEKSIMEKSNFSDLTY